LIIPPIAETAIGASNFVFGVCFISTPILFLFNKQHLRTYTQLLTIFDEFIAVTDLIVIFSGFVEVFLPPHRYWSIRTS
jgi:hypothetical protein